MLVSLIPFFAYSQVRRGIPFTSTRPDATKNTVDYYCASLLDSLQEPSFWKYSKDSSYQAYRFLWIPSFDEPICLRLEINPNYSGRLIIKKGLKDPENGIIRGVSFDSIVVLNSRQVNEII